MFHFSDRKWSWSQEEMNIFSNSSPELHGESAGAEPKGRLVSYLFPTSRGLMTDELSLDGNYHGKEPLGLAGYIPLRESQAPGNQVYSTPVGVGGPALQEVLEKLKGTCGKLLVYSSAKNNLRREQKDMCEPFPTRKPSEGISCALLREAPVQGQTGHHPSLHTRPTLPPTGQPFC